MITQERVKELFDYDPETGWFRHKESRGSAFAGNIAGWDAGHYWRLSINKFHFYAHHLAWLYVYGEWPAGEIDHKDGNHYNNTISNLRLATSSQNKCNANRVVGESGLRGVYWDKSSFAWKASIQVRGRQIHLGMFIDPNKAHRAYLEAAELYHGEFALHNRNQAEELA